MSIDLHRHCQKTVLSANGVGNQDGKTWNTIYALRNSLSQLPTNWISQFADNKDNITQDFATTLRLINGTAEKLDGRLQIIEGQVGQLNTAAVTCYMAPNNDWYYANSDKTLGNSSTFIWHQDASDGNRVYYTRRNDASEAVPEYSYSYDVDGEHRLYPGNDSNLELQYKATGNNKKKYPVFQLNQAMSYLRRFRANGAIEYRALTQYGVYNYGTAA